MTVFIAQSKKDKSGGLWMGSENNAIRFKAFLQKNPGIYLRIEPVTPESTKQRRFFEGAVIPMITYFQDGMDHREPDDNKRVREWIKLEFCPDFINIEGKRKLVPGSTKGKLEKDHLIEKVIGWMEEQGMPTELLSPNDYKSWNDTIRMDGDGPDNYIDFLVLTKKLWSSKKKNKII